MPPSPSCTARSRDDKLWPQASWVKLGKRFIADGWRIALPQGNEAEQMRAELIAAGFEFVENAQLEVWPSLKLDAVVDRLAGTQGVVGVDSGLSHIAVALELPHVQIYNYPTAWRTGPLPSTACATRSRSEGRPTPSIEAVWAAWNRVLEARTRMMRRRAAPHRVIASRASARAVVLGAAEAAACRRYLLRCWWRGRAEPTLPPWRCGERLGRYAGEAPTGMVWLHAVSLGETRAAAALDRRPARRTARPAPAAHPRHRDRPRRRPTRCCARATSKPGCRSTRPGAVRRFFAHFKPAVGVLMETEIWPNLLHAAQARGVPMVLANARLSERSQRKGERLAALLRPALQVAAPGAGADRRRRAPPARQPAPRGAGGWQPEVRHGARRRANGARPVLARSSHGAASCWPRVRAKAKRRLCSPPGRALTAPRPLLLLVPRHPQRFDEVAQLVRAAGLTLARRSAWADAPASEARAADVWLGDSMGEMAAYYAAAQVALLGGSFAPLGGQNLIEAAACGCPVVMGPHTFNFAEAAYLALQAGAAVRVPDLPAGVACAAALINGADRSEWSVRASSFVAGHRGAAKRMANAIQQLAHATQLMP